MKKEEFEIMLIEKRKSNEESRKREIIREAQIDLIKLSIVEFVDKVSLWSSTASFTTAQQLVSCRKALKDFDVDIKVGNISYDGKPVSWDSIVPDSIKDYGGLY